MATLLTIDSNPDTFTDGNWPEATFNSGVWRFTFQFEFASNSPNYSGFHSFFCGEIVGGASGGLWFVNAQLQLFDTGDNVVGGTGFTFSAGQTVTITVDTEGPTRQITIAGATTGNGTSAITGAGPYFNAGDLAAGGVPGEAGFGIAGTFGDVDDGTSGESIIVESGTFALTGGATDLQAGGAVVAGAGSFALTGGAVDITASVSGATIDAESATFTLGGGATDLLAVTRVEAGSGSFALTGGDADLSPGASIVVGDHELDAQPFPFSDRDALITLVTQASGSVVVLLSGGQSADITQTWTDNKSNTIRKLTAVQDYPDFGGYGTQVGVTHNPMTGGSNHQFTIQTANGDENTSFAVEVIGGRRVKHLHVNDDNAGSGTTLGIGPITTDGPAVLIAGWFGSHPVNPPFPNPTGPSGTGEGTPFTAVPDNGFSVVHSYLHNYEFGEVQAACATREVSAAGSYSVTWTHSPAQGAQLWLVAVELAATTDAAAGAFAVQGGDVTLDASAAAAINLEPGAFALTGGDAALQAAGVIVAEAGSLTLSGGAADVAAASEVAAGAGAFALTGGDATPLLGARVVADTAAFALTGGDASIAGAGVVLVESGAFALTGGDAALVGSGDESLDAAAASFSVTGGAADLVAVAVLAIEPGAFALTGGDATIELSSETTEPTPLPGPPEPGSFGALVAEMDALIIEHLG